MAAGFSVFATTDGGGRWQESPLPVTSDGVGAVSFANRRIGWAVGGGGIIVVTADGGATWTSHSMGAWTALYDVACADSDNAWAVGEGGLLLSLRP
jgi:photosystem II stability/assembly factor-like uncharacterized protein